MRIKTLMVTLCLACAMTATAAGKKKQTLPEPVFNRAPLVEAPYAQLPLGEIKPQGWLNEQSRLC